MKRLAVHAALKISYYLRNKVTEDFFKKYSHWLNVDTAKELIPAISDNPDVLFMEENNLTKNRYKYIYDIVSANPIAISLIESVVLYYMDTNISEIFTQVCPTATNGATIELATKITYPDDEFIDHYSEAVKAFELIKFLFSATSNINDCLRYNLVADTRFISFLYGDDIIDFRLKDYAETFDIDNDIKRIESHLSWDDLKVDSNIKSSLERLCNQVTYRNTVLEDWHLRDKYTYGRSISAIFSGAPGTGKTMAAHVIANRLGLEIFKVDLSQIVDKYIGETEKKLEEIFKKAEKSNMILFFDEADSILGKRSEVKESKDKYANTEVSYLLQRMEEYDGIVIMATNFKNNVDHAFLRRFRFDVAFTMPSAIHRLEIWESLISDSIPHEKLDLEFLANKFEFSGAKIKNIVINAVFDAASQGGILKMSHLVQELYNEEKKEGHVISSADLKEYGMLVRA